MVKQFHGILIGIFGIATLVMTALQDGEETQQTLLLIGILTVLCMGIYALLISDKKEQ